MVAPVALPWGARERAVATTRKAGKKAEDRQKGVRKRDRARVVTGGRQLAIAVLLATLVAHVPQLWRLTKPICSTFGTVAAPVYWPEVAGNIRATKEPRSS
jgi:hypothetical protein